MEACLMANLGMFGRAGHLFFNFFKLFFLRLWLAFFSSHKICTRSPASSPILQWIIQTALLSSNPTHTSLSHPFHTMYHWLFCFDIFPAVSLCSMWSLSCSSQLANRIPSQLLAIYFHRVVKKKRLFSIFFSTHYTKF